MKLANPYHTEKLDADAAGAARAAAALRIMKLLPAALQSRADAKELSLADLRAALPAGERAAATDDVLIAALAESGIAVQDDAK